MKDALDWNSRFATTHLPSLTMDRNRKRRLSQSSFCRKSLNGVILLLWQPHRTLKSGLGVRGTAFTSWGKVRARNGEGTDDQGPFFPPAIPGLPGFTPAAVAASPNPGHVLPSSILPESFAVVEIKFRFFRATQPSRAAFLKMRSGNTLSQCHLRHVC